MKDFWKGLSLCARVAVVAVLGLATGTLVVLARRDLESRDPNSIRGDRDRWDTVTRFPGGAAASLVIGRRGTA